MAQRRNRFVSKPNWTREDGNRSRISTFHRILRYLINIILALLPLRYLINIILGLDSTADDVVPTNFGVFKVAVRLEQYYPTSEIKLAQSKKFEQHFLSQCSPFMREYLVGQQLDPSNITDVLRFLIQIEDLDAMQPYYRLCQKNIFVQKDISSSRPKFEINVSNGGNIENVLSCNSDEVVFIPCGSLMPEQCENIISAAIPLGCHMRTLEEISKNTVYVTDDNNLDSKVRPIPLNTRYDIVFRPNRLNFRVQYWALEKVDDVIRKYIFPTKNLSKVDLTTRTSLEIINKQIISNPEQLQAVQRIVDGANANAPYIVVGPPGTGKTTTIVEAVLQLYIRDPKCHILITAGSNSACDTVAQKICEHFEKCPRLTELSHQRWGLDVKGKPKPPKDILRVYSKSWRGRNDLLIKNANFIGAVIVTPSVQALQKYNIIVVTLCTMGRLSTGIIGQWPFTHVFIDEAGALTEPETLLAITSVNTNSCRVIMSGDTKQLGPVIMSRAASKFGLKYSLMERLLARECYAVKEDGTYDSTLQTRLRRNYRSHPEILRLFNHLYYKNELLAEMKMGGLLRWNELEMLRNKKFPIIFQAVYGKVGKSESSESSYNQDEVDKVVDTIKKLLDHADYSEIGVISPYKLQCAQIKRKLRQTRLEDIEVGTAELFQGREKHIIIVSFVKSNCNLGFVTDKQRLNVVLSRPQSLLILVGNPDTLQSNKDFKYLIKKCQRMGTFHKIVK